MQQRWSELSEDTQNLIMNSWAAGTKKQYNSHINRWISYCKQKGFDPFCASVENGAEFLTYYFKEFKVDYSSVNTARSALSAVIPPFNGVSFGNQPLIKRLLKGVFKLRPTLPKYTVRYDVGLVFSFIRSLPDAHDMSLELLSKCTATLLCLLSGQRSQTLGAFQIDFMYLDQGKCVFYIPTSLKQSRPTFHQEPIEYVRYPFDQKLCPIMFIDNYIKTTSTIRDKEEKKFFLSYVSPHKGVSSTTLARWVCDILSKSGVNTVTFTAHSTRSASSSTASKNLSLVQIAKAAGWSNVRTFAKYYDKPIEENYGSAVLKSCNQ